MTTRTARSMSVIGAAVLLASLLLPVTTAAHADEKFPKCFDASRNGHCVAVWVNGQQSIRLTKPTKKMLEPLGGLKSGGDETHYEVPQPIRGALELRVDWRPEAVAYFGAPPEVSVHVQPLEGQRLDTQAVLSTAPSVQVGGSAAVTRADVVKGNRLPPGKYLLAIRVHGSKRNWDRQTLYVQVAE